MNGIWLGGDRTHGDRGDRVSVSGAGRELTLDGEASATCGGLEG